ncbi:MAG: Low conductance mechanosensitive channel YnaI [Candidatus Anoxychlamydiales bacterium]|nr:Low conductance mechanosensitive channel YnaI [Candidatus Anoxychlamydiales bacterium]
MKKKFSFHDFVVSNYAILLQIAITIAIAIILVNLVKIIYNRLHSKLIKSKRVWDDALLISLKKPLISFIWLNAISIALHLTLKKLSVEQFFLEGLDLIKHIGNILIILWFLARFIRHWEINLFKISISPKGKIDKTSLRAISQLLRLAVIIIAVLALLQAFGIPLSGVIAFGGVSGIAVGFAAKDTLSNFFGGLMIFLDRPFVIGEWIRSPDKNIEGYVEQIGWRLTLIRTFDKRPLYVPNGTFSSISLENASRMQNRRIKTTFGIRYDDSLKIKDIINEIEEMLKNHPEIDTSKILFAKLVNFGPSALEIMLYTFTKTTAWVPYQKIQQDIFLSVIDIVHSHGAQIAFPTTTLHVPDGIDIRSKME